MPGVAMLLSLLALLAASLVPCPVTAGTAVPWPAEGSRLSKPATGLPPYLVGLREVIEKAVDHGGHKHKCGNRNPILPPKENLALKRDLSRLRTGSLALEPVQEFKVYFHNRFYINTAMKSYTGYVTAATLQKQLKMLNDGFAGKLRAVTKGLEDDGTPGPADTRIVFKLAGMYDWPTYKYNKFGMAISGRNWNLFRRHARIGNCTDLNVFLHKETSYGVLGISVWPQDCKRSTWKDGAFIDYRSVPGGNLGAYSLGLTLVHEVGHWVGLYHVFSDNGATVCDIDEDEVPDTPDGNLDFGCPVKAPDSCRGPLFPGKDPVRNVMGYVDDACMWKLTPGQATRAYAYAKHYRPQRTRTA